MNIRIAIADDHPMIIGGLKNMLSVYPHIRLAGAYGNGADLLQGLQENQPDVLLLDIQLPDKTGDMLAPVILKHYPDIRILALTNLNSALYVHNMLRMGVLGYVLKNTDPEVVIRAVETVYEGKQFIDPALLDSLDQFTQRMKRESALKPALTPREKEILRMTVNGDTIQEISEKLFIGLRTVEYYRSNLFLKLDVRNMAGLIRKALLLGLSE
ncbi:response regulator [Taibaiella koreensis]|uniref:response regulator n=1 Tax=Taibaiella koreensis TaxID=1268548 RepID=UPI000E59987A|nr:response regulator transcription factor [Taibaiella koreensis]